MTTQKEQFHYDDLTTFDFGALEQKPLAELADFSRIAAADGIVMLENNGVLPLKKGETVSVFGRIQADYIKSGTGSGGLVNVLYKTNIPDSLREDGDVRINEELADVYKTWLKENPYDDGGGWHEPWSQVEMPLDEKTVETAAENSDAALVLIGRTAGEAKDNFAGPGSYELSPEEENMIALVTKYFKRVCVILNVGNVIDMKWVKKYGVGAVLYVWQGGQEGGRAAVDVLTGKVTPNGKLADTVACDIADYPSTLTFGRTDFNVHYEDIYVGYRYFETFAPEKVLYPFGYGLSYTTFKINFKDAKIDGNDVLLRVSVKNTGKTAGKEVVQIYYEAPQGRLGKPVRQLAAYKKTQLLEPGKTETLEISFKLSDMASYDDSGKTGFDSAYVLEAGDYGIFVGNSVRNCEKAFSMLVKETQPTEFHTQILAPRRNFNRIVPIEKKDGGFAVGFEAVRTQETEQMERAEKNLPDEIAPTGDLGYKLVDVKNGKCTMDAFIAQLSDDDLCCLVRGEGMNSPKVTGGTGCCYGGVTDSLVKKGIPPVCGTDGPSGIRMDIGYKATAMPNGVLLASTWDPDLCRRLYVLEGIEMRAYEIDTILGPGINIHRNPLNGRNFEYFSEDPLLTGTVAAAICQGVAKAGVNATIKHFFGNSQELNRKELDTIVSERAAREIYAKAFGIAVKNCDNLCIMTSYNRVNGVWSAGNYDLNHVLLREEWGFKGFVMTDWWALTNCEGEKAYTDPHGTMRNLSRMIRAENDIFMVCAESSSNDDNLKEGLAGGLVTRAELQRSAKNLLSSIMNSPALERFVKNGSVVPEIKLDNEHPEVVYENFEIKEGEEFYPVIPERGKYEAELIFRSPDDRLVQNTLNVSINNHNACSFTVAGTDGETVTEKRVMNIIKDKPKFKLLYSEQNIEVIGLRLLH